MKKLILTTITLIAFTVLSQSTFAEMMLFVGEGCSHCANVERYIEANDIQDKIDIGIYEIRYGQENVSLYQKKAIEAGYSGGAVPFLFDDEEFKIGDKSIISYLDEKSSLTDSPNRVNIAEIGQASVLDLEDSEDLNEIIGEEVETTDISTSEEADSTKGIKDIVTEKPILGVVAGLIVLILIVFIIKKRK